MTAHPALALVVAVLGGLGVTLVLAELPWFSHEPLERRLRPYVPGGRPRGADPRTGDPASRSTATVAVRDLVLPAVTRIGDHVGRTLGVGDPLAVRLARAHSPLTPADARLRQLGWSLTALVAGGLVALQLAPDPLTGLVLTVGPAAVAGLAIEHQHQQAAARWQERTFRELPVIAEQVAVLLAAGWSLGAALDRTAQRGRGACARDLAAVTRRVRQGADLPTALREWADRVAVPEVDRLVAVLALDRDTADLATLVAAAADQARQEAHRRLVVAIERRAQQVWIPVTVAALVPGTIFIAIPFVDALRLFAA